MSADNENSIAQRVRKLELWQAQMQGRENSLTERKTALAEVAVTVDRRLDALEKTMAKVVVYGALLMSVAGFLGGFLQSIIAAKMRGE